MMTFDRTLRKLAQVHSEKIGAVRDEIEHIDKDIFFRTDGQAHLLTAEEAGDKLQIAEHEISFYALHATIRALYNAGLAMINALPSVTEVSDAANLSVNRTRRHAA